MVVGSLLRTILRGSSRLLRSNAVGKLGKALSSSRLGRSFKTTFGGYKRFGKNRLFSRKTPFATRVLNKTKTGFKNISRYGRRGLKGAWRKFEVDPASTALSAYSATRTPSLKLQFDDDQFNSIRNSNRERPYDNLIYSRAYSAW